MISLPLHSDPKDGINGLLKEGARVKQQVREITQTYATSHEALLTNLTNPLHRSESTSVTPVEVHRGHDAPTVLEENVKAEEDAFKAAMREYELAAKDNYKTGIDPDGEHSLKQLDSTMSEALKKRQTDLKGFWCKIYEGFKKLGDWKDDIEGWLGLLPSESKYLSIVAGGLKLVLTAAARLKKVDDQILVALQEIPCILNGAQRVLNIYKDSQALKSLSQVFYLSTLAALGHILNSLSKKRVWRPLKALTRPGGFEGGVLDKIDKMKKDRDAFNYEADVCQKEMLGQLASASSNRQKATIDGILSIEQRLKIADAERIRANQVTSEMLEDIRRRQSDLGRKMDSHMVFYERLMNLLENGDSVYEYAAAMLRPPSIPKQFPSVQSHHQASPRVPKSKATAANRDQSRQQLLSQLDYDHDTSGRDIESNYNLGPSLPREDQERGIYMIKSDKIKAWLTAKCSTALLVNGKARSVQRRSASAFFCARLALALKQLCSSDDVGPASQLTIVPLYFFCGEHRSNDYNWETPSGVLNSLLAQLLTQCDGLDLTKAIKLGEFDNSDVKAVFKRFEYAIMQLSSDITVLCIIDGLSYYLDKRETSRDAEEVMSLLLKLSRPKRRRILCVFKLLLTAPNRFHAGVDSVSEDMILNVPPTLPRTGGFIATKWQAGMDQQLQNLSSD